MKTQPIEVWCTDCGCQMVQRRNKKTGDTFWGCSAFPACRHTLTDQDAADQHDPPVETYDYYGYGSF